MIYTRVKSYTTDGKFTGCEHLYRKTVYTLQTHALQAFRKEYPEHDECILVAEDIDDEKPEYAEYVNVCRECGVIH